jgi:hypothetical protein
VFSDGRPLPTRVLGRSSPTALAMANKKVLKSILKGSKGTARAVPRPVRFVAGAILVCKKPAAAGPAAAGAAVGPAGAAAGVAAGSAGALCLNHKPLQVSAPDVLHNPTMGSTPPFHSPPSADSNENYGCVVWHWVGTLATQLWGGLSASGAIVAAGSGAVPTVVAAEMEDPKKRLGLSVGCTGDVWGGRCSVNGWLAMLGENQMGTELM